MVVSKYISALQPLILTSDESSKITARRKTITCMAIQGDVDVYIYTTLVMILIQKYTSSN